MAINPFNQRNPRLTNDLRAYKTLYIRRDSSTDIESSLQIRPFYAKQSQIPKSQVERNRFTNKGI